LSVLDAYIKPCQYYKDNLGTDPRNFEQWKKNLSNLWSRLDNFRLFHNKMFCHDYTSVIYHHIFMEELFECLPATLRTDFVMLPSGDLVFWELNAAFADSDPGWFSEEFEAAFDNIQNRNKVVCFECHREHDYIRQTILAHELFHNFVKYTDIRNSVLRPLVVSRDYDNVISAPSEETAISQLEELFCDYAATWFYGPVFMRAFAEEVSYYPVKKSPTHPSTDLRAAFLLAANPSWDHYKGFQALKDYLALWKRENTLQPLNQKLSSLGEVFKSALLANGLTAYVHQNVETVVEKSFQVNLPYLSEDIRTFINNLPSKGVIEIPERFDALVSESLRKISMLRRIKKTMPEKTGLFDPPAAIANKTVNQIAKNA